MWDLQQSKRSEGEVKHVAYQTEGLNGCPGVGM